MGAEIQVVAVAVSSSRESVLRTIDENRLDYPIYFSDAPLSSTYRVDSLPTTYAVNADGKIVSSSAGFTAGWELERMSGNALD